MRLILGLLAAGMALLPPQAYACRGASVSYDLFFPTAPESRLKTNMGEVDADLVAEVLIVDDNIHTGRQFDRRVKLQILNIFHSSKPDLKPGSVVPMRFSVSSCGPSVDKKTGIIVAQWKQDKDGREILKPLVYRPDGEVFDNDWFDDVQRP
jgi:hypothetical protein